MGYKSPKLIDEGAIMTGADSASEAIHLARRPARLLIALLVSVCSASSVGGQYPAHWWTPVDDANKPDWEILPQAAKSGEVILSKRNELGILSNFASTPFIFHGVHYASVEGFWQMMLYPEGPNDARARASFLRWPNRREEVAQMTALEAKAAGDIGEANMRKLGIDWVTFEGHRMLYRSMTRGEHYRLIVEAMRAKLAQNPKVREILLSTGNLILLPDHKQEANAPPEWAYFRIWMDIRNELQGRVSDMPPNSLANLKKPAASERPTRTQEQGAATKKRDKSGE